MDIKPLIKKYETYISNIEWDTKVNERKGEEKERNDKQVRYYQEFLNDLAALQPSTLPLIDKGSEAIEFAEWISSEGYMRLSKKVGHKWVKIGEPETYETAEVLKLFKLWIESDRICTENVKRAFKTF